MIEQVLLLAQRRESGLRQPLREILTHRAQASHDLGTIRAVPPDLVKSEMNKIIPVWCLKDHPESPVGIEEPLVV